MTKSKFIKTIRNGAILTVIIVLTFVGYMENSISEYVSKDKFESIVTQFNETEGLPEHFYEVVKNYNPGILSRNPWSALVNVKLFQNRKSCSCGELYIHPGFVDNYTSLAPYVVQLELYEKVGSKKCYDYLIAEFVKSRRFKNVNELSQSLFSKAINNLSEREILLLDLFSQNVGYYFQYKADSASMRKIVDELIKRN